MRGAQVKRQVEIIKQTFPVILGHRKIPIHNPQNTYYHYSSAYMSIRPLWPRFSVLHTWCQSAVVESLREDNGKTTARIQEDYGKSADGKTILVTMTPCSASSTSELHQIYTMLISRHILQLAYHRSVSIGRHAQTWRGFELVSSS